MLGIIGTGSMGTAILQGVLKTQIIQPKEIVIANRTALKTENLADTFGVNVAKNNISLVETLGTHGIVIIAVKPALVANVLSEIAIPARKNNTLIISLAAGIPLTKLAQELAEKQPIIRVMPNVNTQIGKGISAICANEHATKKHLSVAENIFQAIGTTIQLPETQFGAFTAIAGSSPAWTFTYIANLAQTVTDFGIDKNDALSIAAQAVLGSAELLISELDARSPQELINSVTSPNGTTIAGLNAMEQHGFSKAIQSGVKAAIKRDFEISEENA